MSENHQALLLELNQATWVGWLRRVQPWLATTSTLQSAYRWLLDETAESLHIWRERS